jgi:hypothetical protein
VGGLYYIAFGYLAVIGKYRELDVAKAVDYQIVKAQFSLDLSQA